MSKGETKEKPMWKDEMNRDGHLAEEVIKPIAEQFGWSVVIRAVALGALDAEEIEIHMALDSLHRSLNQGLGIHQHYIAED